ncbi:MAG: aldehyde ferredoxin oxidoreductase C-terminal domain-containing protein [Anaerolineales bacterium]
MAEEKDFYNVWRVNTETQEFQTEPVPDGWEQLGGRGLLARILVDEVDARCDPLGPNNKLIFAPGLLVGHKLSSCDRISIGGKSPLTGGVKEANAGGRTGRQLSLLGIKALIIEGQPADEGWWVLHLTTEGVTFERRDDLPGLGVYDAAEKLIEHYGDNAAIALIGQGGERGLRAAGIQNLDKDQVPSRIAARGGLGAVMGSKGLKAIVIDGSQGDNPPAAHPDHLKETRQDYIQALLAHPQTKVYQDYGTAAMTMMANSVGVLPTRNFSSGQFEKAENLSGEHLRETLLSRGKQCETTHACMAGCVIQSSNVMTTEDGEVTVSPMEYETLGLVGSNLGLDTLDDVARINYLLNDLGLDTIEIGAALGVAAEAGFFEFGDPEGALKLVKEIKADTPLGRILGNGAGMTGKIFNITRVPTVKNQAISAYDPRALKGTGVTYATSPQGADHTSGLTIRADIDHLRPEGQVELSRQSQYQMAGYDTLGACIFSGFGYGSAPELIPNLLNAIYDWDVGEDILTKLGRESIRLERKFNHMAGFTEADDRLPEWMTREPLPPHNTVFDVPGEELDKTFEE